MVKEIPARLRGYYIQTSGKSMPVFRMECKEEDCNYERSWSPRGNFFFFRLEIMVLLFFSLLRWNQTALRSHADQSHPGQPAGRSALAFSADPTVGQTSELYSGWAQAPFPRPGRIQLPGPWLWGVIVMFQLMQIFTMYMWRSHAKENIL